MPYTLKERWFMWKMHKLNSLYMKLADKAQDAGWTGLATDLEERGFSF